MYNHESFDPMSGVLFNGLHSYRDYGLFLMEPPDYGNPEPKIYGIDIPGADGTLDTTEATTGNVTYANRQQTYRFKVQVAPWTKKAVQDRIRNALHGRTVQIIPDEDPEWFYTGRAAVSFPETHAFEMQVVVTVSAYPYKLALYETELVLAPADFETADTVILGTNESLQDWNSVFYFGNSSKSTMDFGDFLRFELSWSDARHFATATIQLNDTDGHVYNQTVSAIGASGAATVNLSDIGTVVASKIWRVLVSGIGGVTLTGVPSGATYSQTIYNERMPVVPVITSTFETNVAVFVNGVGATITPGDNQPPELQLQPGENTLYVWAFEGNGTLAIKYREGSL